MRRSAVAKGLIVATLCASALVATPYRPAAATAALTLDGHGYGHGIGLSQYGALGYAIDFGWSSAQILDHYYGATVAAAAPNSDMTVRLTALDGAQTAVVHDRGTLTMDGWAPAPGQPATWRSLVAREVAGGHYRVWGRTDTAVCPTATTNLDAGGSGWTVVIADQTGPVTFRPSTDTSASADYADLAALCEPSTGRVRSYRGGLRAVNSSAGANRTVNVVALEQYLRSVVGGEVSWGWAALGGGKGAQALQAQAVAARSYGLAENKESYAKTCDNTCQTYRGAAYRAGVAGAYVAQEFAATDAAVAATAGVVRRVGSAAGPVAYTMFSSSSGGYTAVSSLGFTPVVDLGDSVTGNAGHSWTTTIDGSRIEAAYPSIGSFTGISVTTRDGNGEWGGRVLKMTVTGTAASVETTGGSFRSALGLKSNWFTVAGGAPPSEACAGRRADLVPGAGADATASRFTPLAPRRLIDTRIGLGTQATPVGGGCTLEIDPDVVAGATAVVVNVTAVSPPVGGYLTAYPCGADRPLASIVPVVPGRIIPGTAIVPLDANGNFCLFASIPSDLVVDLSGVYAPNAGDGFEPIAAQRRFDSRVGALVRPDTVVRVQIAGSYGIPASATGAAITLHTSNSVADGYVTAWPCDPARPTTSVLNATSGVASANHLQVGLDATGGLCLYAQTAMHLVVDVSGWFGPTAASQFHAQMPSRLVDTREDVGLAGPFAAGQNRPISVVGAGGVPATGVTAIAAEVTAVDAAQTGYITVHPCLTPIPTISMVRNVAKTTAATTVTGIVDGSGRWCLQTNVVMDAVIDVSGWYG